MNNTRYDFGHHQTIVTIKLDEHVHATDNPHKVTKGQVGLGNVDNVSFNDIKNYTNTYAGSYLTVTSSSDGKYLISLFNKNNEKLGNSIEIDTDNEYTIESATLDLTNKKIIFERKNSDDLICDISSLVNYLDNKLDGKLDKAGGTITGSLTVRELNPDRTTYTKNLEVGSFNGSKGVRIQEGLLLGKNSITTGTGTGSRDLAIISDGALAITSGTGKGGSGDAKINGTTIPCSKTLFTTDGGTIKGNVTIEPGTEHESAAQLNICTHGSSEGKLSLGAGSLAVSGKNGGGEIASALDLKLTARMGNVIISSQTEDESPASSGVTIDGTAIPRNKTLETVDNKVTSWSTITTDTHYPSEKLVKAECDNIRAVAEGKCKTYVLSYSTSVPTEETFSSGWYCTSDGTPLDTWEEFISYLSPIRPTWLVNRNFNNQSGSISLEFTEEEEGEVITYNCSYLLVKRVENNSWKYMVLKFLDLLQQEVTPFKIGDVFLVTETSVPDRWYAGSNVLCKLETSKVDLSWSAIENKPTTLAGYGITDAVNTTGAQWITGQKTFRGSQVLADGRYDNPTYKWTFYVSGSSYPQLGGLHIYTNSQNGSGLWLTNNGQSLVAVKDPADTNSYSSVGGYFLNGNNQATYQFFNDLFLSDAIYTATKKEGTAGTSRTHYYKLGIPTLTADSTIATTTDLNSYLPLSGGTLTGDLTAPKLIATNSIEIGNTTLHEDDLKRLLGSLVVNGTSNGDLY